MLRNGLMANLTCRFRCLSRILPISRQIRCYHATGDKPRSEIVMNTLLEGRIGRWLKQYEDFVGITEVKTSQGNVIKAENYFQEKLKERRTKQLSLTDIQSRIRNVKEEIEKATRGTDLYLELMTKENSIIKEERSLSEVIEACEQEERDAFSDLQSAVRESHEKERQYSERTKYWSVIGSVIGVVLGIFGTTINNKLRMNELKRIVSTADRKASEYKDIAGQLCIALEKEHSKLEELLTNAKTSIEDVNISDSTVQPGVKESKTYTDILNQSQEILTAIKKQDKLLDQQLTEIKKILSSTSNNNDNTNVVYVGPEIKGLLNETEGNLEWKMKINALWTVTFIYGALALTVPVIFSIFKGS